MQNTKCYIYYDCDNIKYTHSVKIWRATYKNKNSCTVVAFRHQANKELKLFSHQSFACETTQFLSSSVTFLVILICLLGLIQHLLIQLEVSSSKSQPCFVPTKPYVLTFSRFCSKLISSRKLPSVILTDSFTHYLLDN